MSDFTFPQILCATLLAETLRQTYCAPQTIGAEFQKAAMGGKQLNIIEIAQMQKKALDVQKPQPIVTPEV